MRLPVFAFMLALTWASTCPAKVSETTGYTKSQALNCAFRYLRVDSAFKITEQDLDLGYLLFEYPTGNGDRTTTGSVEVIERQDEVVLIVQIPKLPSYHESVLIRGLVSKLRADYGEPPKSRKGQPDESEPPSADSGKQKAPRKDDEKEADPAPEGPVPRYRIK